MSRDFDDELERSSGRRSRKNPKMREENSGGLKVFDDDAIHPLPKAEKRAEDTKTKTRAAAAETAAASAIPLQMENQLAKRRKRRRLITMIVAECFVLAAIFGYAYFLKHWNMIQRPDFQIEVIQNDDLDVQTVEKMKGYWTIAVFGVDARDRAIAKGTNADVNLICNINRDTGEIKLVSVFRDSYLNISENGSYNKINQAYFLGGPEQAVAALNRNLDLNITDYMTFNWKAVADAINILGGVDIELSKAEFYYINSFITETVKVTGIGSHHLTKAGMNHLDGVQAVAYGRLRLMDTDYARTERQRKVITQAFEKAKKADFNTLNTIIGTVFPQIATSIGVDDLVKNARGIGSYHIGETTGFPQARGDANMGKKGACVIPQTLESNVVQLHTFLFGDEVYTPSTTVKNISSKIAQDSGLYKEGKFIDKVSTEGGVIQQPKTTSASKEESSTKSTKEYETDEDGNRIEETTKSEKPGTRPTTAAETDEDGNPIETEESSPVRPGGTVEETTASRPGGTTGESTTASRPGETNNEPTTASRPGGTTETTAAPRPGGTNETTASTPGTPGGAPTETTVSSPGGAPGSTKPTETVGNQGPGGQSSDDSGVTTIIGTVGAPGQ